MITFACIYPTTPICKLFCITQLLCQCLALAPISGSGTKCTLWSVSCAGLGLGCMPPSLSSLLFRLRADICSRRRGTRCVFHGVAQLVSQLPGLGPVGCLKPLSVPAMLAAFPSSLLLKLRAGIRSRRWVHTALGPGIAQLLSDTVKLLMCPSAPSLGLTSLLLRLGAGSCSRRRGRVALGHGIAQLLSQLLGLGLVDQQVHRSPAAPACDCQGRMHRQRILCCCLIRPLHTQRLCIFLPATALSRGEVLAQSICSRRLPGAHALPARPLLLTSSRPITPSAHASSFLRRSNYGVRHLHIMCAACHRSGSCSTRACLLLPYLAP